MTFFDLKPKGFVLERCKTYYYCYIRQDFTDLKTRIDGNWHNLKIEPKVKEIFAESPVLIFKRIKNLRDIIGGNKVFDNEKVLNVKKFSKGKCQPCFTRSINLT